MNLVNLLLILASVGLSALAQIAMKSGMSAPTVLAAVEQGSVAASYVSILTTPMVWVGLGCYGLGALVWLRVLSAVSLANMAAVELPPAVRTVIIAADNDGHNLGAARALQRVVDHFIAEGRAVHLARSPVGKDFNDFLTSDLA